MNSAANAADAPTAVTAPSVATVPTPFLARFAVSRSGAPTPRGETTSTRAIETTDE
ncbi:MAG: hypothetical protein WC211_00020 [Dehalococcoidia bacterium]